jgi:hypothetical protein
LNTSGKNRLTKQERISGEAAYFYSVSDKLLEAMITVMTAIERNVKQAIRLHLPSHGSTL